MLLRDYTPPALAALLEAAAALQAPAAATAQLQPVLAQWALASGPQRSAPHTLLRVAAACSKLGMRWGVWCMVYGGWWVVGWGGGKWSKREKMYYSACAADHIMGHTSWEMCAVRHVWSLADAADGCTPHSFMCVNICSAHSCMSARTATVRVNNPACKLHSGWSLVWAVSLRRAC